MRSRSGWRSVRSRSSPEFVAVHGQPLRCVLSSPTTNRLPRPREEVAGERAGARRDDRIPVVDRLLHAAFAVMLPVIGSPRYSIRKRWSPP